MATEPAAAPVYGQWRYRTLYACRDCVHRRRGERCPYAYRIYEKAYQRAHYQANKLRPHIIARQGMICAKCGKELTLGRDCCLDFIVPFIAGGQPIGDNLQLLCRPCNSSKSGR